MTSYEDFVATRGPGLYRTAYLLAGDAPRAEQLLQQGLVRLRLEWGRARRAAAVEQHARRVLAEAFLAGPGQPPASVATLVQLPPDPPSPDPVDPLWGRLASLPARERAALVLRHESLSDAQIAEALHRPVGTVPPTIAGALADLGLAPGEADGVADVLTRAAESRVLPLVDADGLAGLADAERARRRRRLIRGTAAGLAVVVATWLLPHLYAGSGPGAPRSSPHSLTMAELARGPDARLPWWAGGELHLGARVLPTNHSEVVSAAGTTLVGDDTVERGRPKADWWYVTGRGLLPLASSSRALFRPVVSPDGRFVAWAQPEADSGRTLVLWDVAARRTLGSLRLRCCAGTDELGLHGIDPRGRVLFDTGGVLRSWTPGERPRTVEALTTSLFEVGTYAGGMTWRARSPDPLGPFPIHYGSLDAAGGLHGEGTVPPEGAWSPDGRRYAWTHHGRVTDGHVQPDAIWVVDLAGGKRLRMRLPAVDGYQVVAWESPTEVVVAVRRDTGRPLRNSDLPDRVQLLRCHAGTGACETAGVASQTILELTPPG
ncbi:MAG TPA: sigma factor-like helix-turn-helix DNA-binding protein [Marmoricola sp.]